MTITLNSTEKLRKANCGAGRCQPQHPLSSIPRRGDPEFACGGGWEAGSGCFLGIYFLFLFGVCGLRQKFMAEVDLLYNPRAAL